MIRWETAAGSARATGTGRPLPKTDVPLAEASFIIVDVETTGWDPEQAQITEIGAVRVSGGQLRERFSSLVDPGGPIPARIAQLTGISDEMVALAPPPRQVLPAFLAFAGDGVLTAHNAPFDVGFLRAGCQAAGLAWPHIAVMDTVELARRVLATGEVPDCKLATLAAFFGARTRPSHRALDDALATADVLLGLLPRLAEAGVTTLTELADFASRPVPARRWTRWVTTRWPAVARLVSGLRAWARPAPRSPRGQADDPPGAGRAVRYRRWLGTGARGGRRGHRDRSDPSRRGAHPADGDGDSPDSAGQ